MDDKTVHVLGIDVEFPYKLYNPQRKCIESIIRSIEYSQNAIIESPTGTGKTLCLLTSSFAYLLSKRIPDLKIIYTTRTHGQLHHIYNEIKKTSYVDKLYNNDINITILGSRDKLCIHSYCSKMNGSALINYCKALVQSKTCTYFNGYRSKEFKGLPSLIDVEDLISMGKRDGFCPFYAMRDAQKTSNFILMPYNYLLSQSIRSSIELDLSNSVIIIDEAHNIDDFAERVSSFTIQESDVIKTGNVLSTLLTKCKDDDTIEFNKLISLSLTLKCIENFFLSIDRNNLKVEQFNDNIKLLNTFALIKSLSSQVFGKKSKQTLEDEFDCLSLLIISIEDGFNKHINDDIQSIGRLKNALVQLMSDWFFSNNKYFFTLFVAENGDRSLQFECMNPVCTFIKLQNEKVRNFIFTSGTLSPVDNFISNIGGNSIKFPIILENEHIVTPDRTWAGSISSKFKSFDDIVNNSFDTRLISTYDTRTDSEYISKLGSLLKTFINAVPGGILCFFPSYSNMNATIKSWRFSGVYKEISHVKEIFIEKARSLDFPNHLDEDFKNYKNIINSGKGTIFFAVFRGKIAEGIDFPNDYCRGVFICGIPYPNPHHFRVSLKMKYLDIMKSDGHAHYDKSVWYVANATRAVNQALGRCIRHVNDYGAILFADARYEYKNIKSYLSKWLLTSFKLYNDIDSISVSLDMFFRKFVKPSNTKSLFNWLNTDTPNNIEEKEDKNPDLHDHVEEDRLIPLQGRPKKRERPTEPHNTLLGLLDKDILTQSDCTDPILSWYKPTSPKTMDSLRFD